MIWVGINPAGFDVHRFHKHAHHGDEWLDRPGLTFWVGLLFLYIQLRVFIWAASGKPLRFFFGTLGWATFNGLIYWAIVSCRGLEHCPGRAPVLPFRLLFSHPLYGNYSVCSHFLVHGSFRV